jgi:hypothetical protein
MNLVEDRHSCDLSPRIPRIVSDNRDCSLVMHRLAVQFQGIDDCNVDAIGGHHPLIGFKTSNGWGPAAGFLVFGLRYQDARFRAPGLRADKRNTATQR